ncbi:hypothetical protein TWF173_000817 [Orbilia oligospora]|nr:hypothetical protein TWF173_000817 [Orbilia oligospora]
MKGSSPGMAQAPKSALESASRERGTFVPALAPICKQRDWPVCLRHAALQLPMGRFTLDRKKIISPRLQEQTLLLWNEHPPFVHFRGMLDDHREIGICFLVPKGSCLEIR